MEISEFLNREETPVESPEELDIQKAVVEALAADKAEQNERINMLQRENYKLKSEITLLKEKIQEQNEALGKIGDVLSINAERPLTNQVTLLERGLELKDRFESETRDHVLEVIKEARDIAEKEGRSRKAMLLEDVLKANEPTGMLAKKREALAKFFENNSNILSGPVLEELNKYGILYKKGEEYLLPSEILKMMY